MAALPNYLQDQTEETIRQRMLDSLPSDLDKSEGSFIWDAVAPTAIELAQAAIWAQEVLRRGFAGTAFGPYLDMRCEEHGLTRRVAVKAEGQVHFTGQAGTVIPAGTRVATPADRVTGTSSVEFVTKQEVTLGETGTTAVRALAVVAGISGNVTAGAVSIMVSPIPGVTSVSNITAMEGGIDTENDPSLLARYLQKVRSPSAGGNKADYVNWALEVPGVGGVSVVPVRDGPGTVSVAIIGSNNEPADKSLVEEVQEYIAPPWKIRIEAEAMTLSGHGVTIDHGEGDDSGSSVKMDYSLSGAGEVRQALHTLLPQPGIWQATSSIKLSDSSGTSNLLQFGVWNVNMNEWVKTTPSGGTNALRTLQADDFSVLFTGVTQNFYWNGQDQLELRLTRLQSDTSTTVWIDFCDIVSTFSTNSGEGKAPVGARVTIESATAVLVNISAALSIATGYNTDSVKAAVVQNIAEYIRSLAFSDDNDVRSVRVGQAILDTTGVLDYSNLLVNGGPGNITVGTQEVAVLGTVSFT
ncbi:baseplate J/gp47 family protein [Paenibacillus ginsengarvi]|uniref:Baseplate J/gp47 family protein n=1 Tax=Paenibacillus ginsengarvi TaxID=400777 RepID=A0A3B0CMA1_9BACL|nr:baseplate J/gp47 family protein [Paenibacillus ginsengarvi]RKN85878.1 hypothetical protein D7M11_05965 [Paenibacillus ginsengarvi]